MSLPLEPTRMKKASLKSERDYEASPNVIDIIIARDGTAYNWNGSGTILAVDDGDIGIWERLALAMPWHFAYKGWSAKLRMHLWERTGDKLDGLFDEREIKEVRYEGQSPPREERQ